MKWILIPTLLVSISSFAGEFFCKSEGKALLRAMETAKGLKVAAYGELAQHFDSTSYQFENEFNARNSNSNYQSYGEGNEHHVWIYELRIRKNPAKNFKGWLKVNHDEMGLSQEFELDCVRSEGPVAHILKGRVTEAFCGEVDPFIIGDACVFYIKEGRTTWGLVADFEMEIEDLPGQVIALPSFGLKVVSQRESTVLREDMNSQVQFLRLDSTADIIFE